MEYRLMNDPGDQKAYEEARKRGEDVYLMKLGNKARGRFGESPQYKPSLLQT